MFYAGYDRRTDARQFLLPYSNGLLNAQFYALQADTAICKKKQPDIKTSGFFIQAASILNI
jgi:hypothetical protein